ncbi:MAG TPA: hypothetical protein VHZ24_18640 [Pirellulales bacterium]|jgi:hypothetical protein|nr:hypothetical protein [Pirellulales bacterium]
MHRTGRGRIAGASVVWLIATSLAAAEPAHLVAARDLLAHVAPVDTNYEHHRGRVVWGSASKRYECHTDCSGLLNHLLEHAYGITDGDLRGWLGTSRPTAKTFHEAIEKENRFLRIKHVPDMRPGDVIAVRYPANSENTGHVMIVAEAPRPHPPSDPLRNGALQWAVAVIDSSMSGHGLQDTRRKADGSFRDGLGQGVLRLYTDPQGAIAGHTWSTFGNSDFHSQSDRHVEVGRLNLK